MTPNEADLRAKEINSRFVAVYDKDDATVHEIWSTSPLRKVSSGDSWEMTLLLVESCLKR